MSNNSFYGIGYYYFDNDGRHLWGVMAELYPNNGDICDYVYNIPIRTGIMEWSMAIGGIIHTFGMPLARPAIMYKVLYTGTRTSGEAVALARALADEYARLEGQGQGQVSYTERLANRIWNLTGREDALANWYEAERVIDAMVVANYVY